MLYLLTLTDTLALLTSSSLLLPTASFPLPAILTPGTCQASAVERSERSTGLTGRARSGLEAAKIGPEADDSLHQTGQDRPGGGTSGGLITVGGGEGGGGRTGRG